MTQETVHASTTIDAPAGAVFAVLADPGHHPAIDGTGWVEHAHDTEPISAEGQVFRVRMFHENHPDGHYEMANQVIAFEPDRVIAWRPGNESPTGELTFGGWTWRYDLRPVEPGGTEVTLTYDWSAVGPEPRQWLQFPPFPDDHLANSLAHLAELVAPS